MLRQSRRLLSMALGPALGRASLAAVLAPFFRGTEVRHRSRRSGRMRYARWRVWSALTEISTIQMRYHRTDTLDRRGTWTHSETTPAGSHACPFRHGPRSPRCCTDYGVRISHQVGVPVRRMELRWGSGLHTRGVHLPPSGQQLLGAHTHRTRARRRRLVSPSARTEGDLELLLGCSQPRRRLLDHCPLPPE